MPVDLGYTVEGRGGVAFWWLDNSGAIPWSALANYNFNLLPGRTDDWASATSGSFLLSTPFFATRETLTIVATMITAHSFPWNDVGFALLLEGSHVKAVLFALRPDGINHPGDLGPIPGNAGPADSAHSALRPATRPGHRAGHPAAIGR